MFQQRSDELQTMVKASYELSLLLARKKKPYSDGEEIVKKSLLIFAQNVGDINIKNKVDNIALSRNTVMRRIDDMGQDVSTQIVSGLQNCKYFSLALDESCDITDNAQLSIFVRYTNNDFDCVEELLDLRQLVSTTGEDIFEELKNVIEFNKVEWKKLDSVCTDGAPCMTGRIKGFVTLLENYLERKVFKYHCIIHQEALCAKDLNLSSVVDPVIRCINKIRALNRRRFRELFPEETEEDGELLLHCNVRWLSKGNALDRFWNLKECVLTYLEENNELPNECLLLKDEYWLWDLAFFTDIMGHLNNLNLRLQGKDCTFPTLVDHISCFVRKLLLFSLDFEGKRLTHFPLMQKLSTEVSAAPNYGKFKNLISILQNSFSGRFLDFQNDKKNVDLFINPFSISLQDLNCYPPEIQIEIIDLQHHSILKNKYKELISDASDLNYIEFWKFVSASSFPQFSSQLLL